ncbi:DUF5752 family protein [[Eubacterium] cellulosolvens]
MGKVEPFKFYYESGITSYTTVKADSITSLFKGIEKVSESSIFYHLHHSYFRMHFTTADYMNDFARWIWVNIGDKSISEKIAIINPFLFDSIKACRKQLLKSLKEYIGGGELFPRVSRDREFYFIELKSFIHPTGYEANNLKEFIKGIERISISGLFYHLIDSRIRVGRQTNDFSQWLKNELGEHEKAEEISKLNLFSLNLWDIRNEIISILEKTGR